MFTQSRDRCESGPAIATPFYSQFLYRSTIIIGRVGASPPSRTNSMIFLYIYIYIYIRSTVRRALNLLRASFSPIFQYFSALNVTRVSFSPVFQYFVTYMYMYVYVRTYIYTYAMCYGIVLSAMDSSMCIMVHKHGLVTTVWLFWSTALQLP